MKFSRNSCVLHVAEFRGAGCVASNEDMNQSAGELEKSIRKDSSAAKVALRAEGKAS